MIAGKKHRKLLCSLAGLLVALVVVLTQPLPALAHARLLSSDPAQGASLVVPPGSITMNFSEPVALEFSSIELLDSSDAEIPLGQVTPGPQGDTSISVPLPTTLAPGTYLVAWRMVSAVDGHLTAGSYSFSVVGPGQGSTSPSTAPRATPAIPTAGGDTADPARLLLRGVLLLCVTLCLGGCIFSVLVVEPTAAERGAAGTAVVPLLSARFVRIGAVAAAVLAVGLVLDLVWQVGAIAGTGPAGALGQGELGRLLLATTRFGLAWGLKLAAALLLLGLFAFGWLRRGADGRVLWEIGIGGGSLYLLAEALSSHAAAVEGARLGGVPLPLISDWAHIATAATWVGGLIYFAAVLFPAFRKARVGDDERRAFLAAGVPRFSKLAMASVGVLGVTGIYNLAIHSTDLGPIFGTLYGQLVAVKVTLFALLIGLGAVNLVRISPRLARRNSAASNPGEGAARLLAVNVRVELAVMGLLLLAAGALTLLPPPTSAYGGASEPPASGAGPTSATLTALPASASTTVGGYTIKLTLTQTKTLEVELSRSDTSAAPLDDVGRVRFLATPGSGDPMITALVGDQRGSDAGGSQLWEADFPGVALQSAWQVGVVVERTRERDLKAAFRLSGAGSSMQVQEIQYLEVRISTSPDQPTSGSNRVDISLVDAGGRAVETEGIRVTAKKAASDRAPLTTDAKAVTGRPGTYEARVSFDRGGGWQLYIDVLRAGHVVWRTSASLDVLDAATPAPGATP